MNRLNHKLKEARREVLHLRGLVRDREGEMREDVDPSVVEKYTEVKDEIWGLVAISESIRKGYKRAKE